MQEINPLATRESPHSPALLPCLDFWAADFTHFVLITSKDLCCCCLVTKSYLTLCNPMVCSMPSFPVLHYFPWFAQTHLHQISDTIQPSHPLSPPSPPAFNLSQHQGLFQWVGSLHQVAKILELQLQHQSFHWVFRVSFRIDWFDLLVSRDSQESSPAPQFESISSSAFCLSYCPALTPIHVYWEPWLCGPLLAKWLLFNTLSRFVIGFLYI